MARRRPAQGDGGPFATGLDTSDTSTSGTKWWVIQHQSFYGMYERRNIYNTTVSSVSVPAPAATYNLLDVNMRVTTTKELKYIDFSAGSFNQYQEIILDNDSVSGGFGVNGTVSTSAIGIIRRPAIMVGGEPAESSGTCTQSFNAAVDKTPGTYDSGNYDTSTDIQPVLFELIKTCKDYCPNFETFLVNL